MAKPSDTLPLRQHGKLLRKCLEGSKVTRLIRYPTSIDDQHDQASTPSSPLFRVGRWKIPEHFIPRRSDRARASAEQRAIALLSRRADYQVREPLWWVTEMIGLSRLGYRFKAFQFVTAGFILLIGCVVAQATLVDTLTVGYAMTIPVYVVSSIGLEKARFRRSSFQIAHIVGETLASISIAVAVGYLGYRLWLLGY